MQLVLTNATVVLADRTFSGTVVVRDGLIEDVQPGRSALSAALDLDGDVLMPGAVDLHTDNLERQVQPRQNARWPSRAALLAHDGQCAAAGITTVFDALCVGDLGFDEGRPRTCAEGMADLDALAPTGLLKADHFLHLRCEVPALGVNDLFQHYARHSLLRMVSLMDHTPGMGQYGDLARYRAMRAGDGEAPAQTGRRIAQLQAQRARLRDANRAALLASARTLPVTLASHDDRTLGEVAENLADGIAVSEFPVTPEAARAARDGGMAVIAGAPNLVRGGSHTGNVGAASLLADGLMDAFASDYVPASLVHAAFVAAGSHGVALWDAVRLVTDAPARMAGFTDRGRIATGLRADLAQVRLVDGDPVIRRVWREGERVA